MFDNRLPTPLVVDLIPIARRVNNVQLELDAVLGDDVRLLIDLGRLPDGSLIVEPSFGVDEVRGKEGVDEG